MTQGRLPKSPKPWWNNDCSRAEKQKKRAWGIFRRYPTEENLIEFKRARSHARRIRRESQRSSWQQYLNSIRGHETSKTVWKKSGFRHHRGTLDNILLLETSVREAFVRNQNLVSIFFDMEKAYDRTWRYGILKDLYHLGFRGNLPVFIQNFLKTRVFQVRVGSTLSRDFYQREGVPQGSVLSVVLFILKINDIVRQLPPTVKGTLFVDDFQSPVPQLT
ncbi:hypothetical protein JTE90_024689 [Oedothorax gibbosus]|uniref:Reverse transcriptase domain-containing protein n=1 Tax=Oedothorax gibbosus TaxID=931172 RepID=A0AAV6UB40_9ARAC|nr:hypothetical protein JTE90_024689 [Oedothorax gibbosus]